MRTQRPDRGVPRGCCLSSCLEAAPIRDSPSLRLLPRVTLKLAGSFPCAHKSQMLSRSQWDRILVPQAGISSPIYLVPPKIPATKGTSPRTMIGLPSLTLGAEWGPWGPFSKLSLSGRKPRAECKPLLDLPGTSNCPAWPYLGEPCSLFFMSLRKLELGLPCRKDLAG